MLSSRSACSTIRSRSFLDSLPFFSKALRKLDRRIALPGWLLKASSATFSLALDPIVSSCSGIVFSRERFQRAIEGHRPHQVDKPGGASEVWTHLNSLGGADGTANQQAQ